MALIHLVASEVDDMQAMMELCEEYSVKYRLRYGGDKTNIVVDSTKADTEYLRELQPWTMCGGRPQVKESYIYLGRLTVRRRQM